MESKIIVKKRKERKKKFQIYLNDPHFSRFSFAQSFEGFFQIFKEKREKREI